MQKMTFFFKETVYPVMTKWYFVSVYNTVNASSPCKVEVFRNKSQITIKHLSYSEKLG